jgi:hypothetical protein
MDQAEFSVGVVAHERALDCGKPKIMIGVLRVMVSRHQNGESSVRVFALVRLDQDQCKRLVCESSLQVLAQHNADKDHCTLSRSRAVRPAANIVSDT